MTSLGASMSNQSVVRLERSLVYSTDDFITMHQVILLSNSIFLWLDPGIDYASAIWSPHVKKDKIALKNVQKFACRMATRSWDSSYQDVLDFVDLPSLECRRLETRLCLLYKIIYKLCYFDDGIFTPSTSLTDHALHNIVLNRPFVRINSYFYSFVPYTISLWNNLDSSFVCAPSVSAFKNNLQLTSLM